MKRASIHDAKTNLSICSRNEAVAEVRSLRKGGVREPRIGAAKGELVVPDSFFEPLPDEILKSLQRRVTAS